MRADDRYLAHWPGSLEIAPDSRQRPVVNVSWQDAAAYCNWPSAEAGLKPAYEKRGDQLVTVAVDLPAGDQALQQFAESWSGGGNPRSALGV